MSVTVYAIIRCDVTGDDGKRCEQVTESHCTNKHAARRAASDLGWVRHPSVGGDLCPAHALQYKEEADGPVLSARHAVDVLMSLGWSRAEIGHHLGDGASVLAKGFTLTNEQATELVRMATANMPPAPRGEKPVIPKIPKPLAIYLANKDAILASARDGDRGIIRTWGVSFCHVRKWTVQSSADGSRCDWRSRARPWSLSRARPPGGATCARIGCGLVSCAVGHRGA